MVPEDINIDAKPKILDDMKTNGYVPSKQLESILYRLSWSVVKRFVELNAFVAEHAKDEVSLDTMKDILSDNVGVLRKSDDPRVLAIADTIDRAVRYRGEDEE